MVFGLYKWQHNHKGNDRYPIECAKHKPDPAEDQRNSNRTPVGRGIGLVGWNAYWNKPILEGYKI